MSKFLALILFLFSANAFPATQFSLGGGVNFNVVDVENDRDLKEFEEGVSANFAIAGKADIEMSEYWIFRTGLWLQEKSAEIFDDNGNVEGILKLNTIYTSIPLNFQYKVHPMIGLYGGYIADIRINDYCNAYDDYDTCTIEKNSESIVHVATLGVSVNVNKWLNIDVGYQHGLSDVVKDTYKLHTFQVMGFYKF